MPKGSVPRNINKNRFVKQRRYEELSASKTATKTEKEKALNQYLDAMEYGGLFRGPDKSKEWTTRSQRTPAAKIARLERRGLAGSAAYDRKKLAKKTQAGRVGLTPIKKSPGTGAKKPVGKGGK